MKRINNMHSDGTFARGRGTSQVKTGRFERYQKVLEHDGWDIPPEPQVARTQVTLQPAKSILTYNSSPDIPFDRSLNPYRGCEHGCIYCYARPSHAFLNLSPGLDFETKLFARPNAATLLRDALSKPAYKPQAVMLGSNTDPYQPIERDHQITRACLQVLHDFQHPVVIITKGALIERDIDILQEMAAQNLATVGITLTTLDAKLSRRLEPRTPAPKRLLQTIETLATAGIPVRVMISPIILGLTDHELESILKEAHDAGARFASWIMLRLPLELSELFTDWLQTHYPNKKKKVLARLGEMYDGQTYTPQWGTRMRGRGIHAQMIARRFKLACAKLNIKTNAPPLRRDLFHPPPRAGDQLSLF